jgi:hypothetical protein
MSAMGITSTLTTEATTGLGMTAFQIISGDHLEGTALALYEAMRYAARLAVLKYGHTNHGQPFKN